MKISFRKALTVFPNSSREQAEEAKYMRQRELEKLKSAKEKAEKAQAEYVSNVFVFLLCFPGQ
jgi:hypothetical protein